MGKSGLPIPPQPRPFVVGNWTCPKCGAQFGARVPVAKPVLEGRGPLTPGAPIEQRQTVRMKCPSCGAKSKFRLKATWQPTG